MFTQAFAKAFKEISENIEKEVKGILNMSKVCKAPQCLNKATMDLVFGGRGGAVIVPWCDSCICPDTWDLHPFHHAESYSQVCGTPNCNNTTKRLNKICDNCYNGAMGHTSHVPTQEQKQAALKEEINAPLYTRQPHYEGGIDPITFGQDNLTPAEMNGFYKMNVIKYVARCDRKNGLEDLQKARDYLNLLIESYGRHPEHDEDVIPVGKYSGKKRESPLIRKHWSTEEGMEHERKTRIAKYKKAAGYEVAEEERCLTEEEEAVLKEAELCADRFHAGQEVCIIHEDVMQEFMRLTEGHGKTILHYGSGEMYVEKHNE